MQAKDIWLQAASAAALFAEDMMRIGLHKQVANRILEPFQHIHVLVTSTEWDNFFDLRCHEDAQPEIHELADRMYHAMKLSTPTPLDYGDWHLPYINKDDWHAIVNEVGNPFNGGGIVELAKKVSAARCCRVSYLKHDGQNPSVEEDIKLFNRLAEAVPVHSSPLEHQATPDEMKYAGLYETPKEWSNPSLHGNFKGWIQFRKEWDLQVYANTQG
jgi:thymidylate synthase ThyX